MPAAQQSGPDSRHPVYQRAFPLWQRVRTFASGAEAIREAGELYLPRPFGMGRDTYSRMLRSAPILAATERTIEGLIGAATQDEPEITAGGIPAEHLEDVTGEGDPLLQLGREVLREILTPWRVGIEVMPDATGRPRWRVRPAESIISWWVSRDGGPERLERAVIRLTETVRDGDWGVRDRPVWRELTLLEDEGQALRVRTWRKREGSDAGGGAQQGGFVQDGPDVLPEVSGGTRMDYVPLTITGTWASPTPPPLRGLVEVNKAHYVDSALLEHTAVRVAAPTPTLTTDNPEAYLEDQDPRSPTDASEPNAGAQRQRFSKPVRFGPDELWVLQAGEILGYTEMKVGGVGALQELVDTKQEQMVALGARLTLSPTPANESATAAAIRHAADVSILTSAIEALEEVMTQAMRWHAQQLGVSDAVSYVPSRAFLEPPATATAEGGQEGNGDGEDGRPDGVDDQ